MIKISPEKYDKEILKLECIGKTGKINKNFQVTEYHLDLVK